MNQTPSTCSCTSESEISDASCCSIYDDIKKTFPWITGFLTTPAGIIPTISTKLSNSDKIGSWKSRWGIGRMNYQVRPGLYAVGNPSPESPVLVTANYKMSFDRLRSSLDGHNAWIMVLNTFGINVWCAAGKGTFGTDELVKRIEAVSLPTVISHRTVILPQLGAPGVSAHEITKRTGFKVLYGPIRAVDIPAFIDSGMKATPDMRQITFPLIDRAVLIPMEIVGFLKYEVVIALAIMILSGFGTGGVSLSRIADKGLVNVIMFMGICIAGAVLTPLLLPWLPGRSFSFKGFCSGMIYMTVLVGLAQYYTGIFGGFHGMLAWFLLAAGVSSFIGMNFTGASTYTSLSGVKKEMRTAVPIQIGSTAAGLLLLIISFFY